MGLRAKYWSQTKPPAGTPINSAYFAGQQLPVLAMPFNEGAGLTTVDVSGSGYVGTIAPALNNGMWWAASQFGSSLSSAEAVSGSLIVGTNPDFTTGTFSWGCWIRPVSITGADAIMVKGNPVSGHGWGSYITSGLNIRTFIDDGTNQVFFDSTGTAQLNVWTHVFCIVDRAAQLLRVFLNGQASGTSASIAGVGSLTSTGRFSMLASVDGDAERSFGGAMDNPLVYARMPTPGEIFALYANPFAMYAPRADRRRVKAVAAPAATVVYKKSRSLIGTKVGSRQAGSN